MANFGAVKNIFTFLNIFLDKCGISYIFVMYLNDKDMKNATLQEKLTVGTQFESFVTEFVDKKAVRVPSVLTIVKITGSRYMTSNSHFPNSKPVVESINTIAKSIDNGFRKIIE